MGWQRLRSPVRLTPASLARSEIEEGALDAFYDGWDACHDGWYGCGVDGCCVDDEWWAPVMPPRAFLRDGVVHMSEWNCGVSAYCGVGAVPYGVRLHSTDEARAYAKMMAVGAEEITCLTCLVSMGWWECRGR